MAYFEPARPAPFGAISAFRVVSFFEGIVATLVAWHVSRTTKTELSKLSDRELDDIGLTRGQIAEMSDNIARRR